MGVPRAEALLAEANSTPPGPGTLHGTGRETEAREDGVSRDKSLPPSPGAPQVQAEPPGLVDSARPPSPQAAPGPLGPDATAHRLWLQGCAPVSAQRFLPVPLPRWSPGGWTLSPQCGVPVPLSSNSQQPWSPCPPPATPPTPGSGSCPLAPSHWPATSLSALWFSMIPFLLRVFTEQAGEQRDSCHNQGPPSLSSGPEELDSRAFLQSWGPPGWAQSSSCPPG